MNVTIFSDASICPETRAGGWAGWIKSDRGVLQVEGQLRAQLLDTTIAEAMAALNCICIAISRDMIQEGDVIVLATDNNNVMSVLEGTTRRKFRKKDAIRRKWSMRKQRRYVDQSNAHIEKVADMFERKITQKGFELRWNHVKGHRGKIDKRAAVNHGCDHRAKTEMRNARRKLKRSST